MTDTSAPAQAPAPVKYSRYAKVRRAQTLEQQPENTATAYASAPTSTAMPAVAPKNESITRSMSRYKKNRPTAPTNAQNTAMPTTPILSDDAHDSSFAIAGDSLDASTYSTYPPAQETVGRDQRSLSHRRSDAQTQRSSTNQPVSRLAQRLSEQQAELFYGSAASQEMMEMEAKADENERAEAARMLLEKSKREDLARLQATLEAATASMPVRGRAESHSTWGKIASSFGRRGSKPRGDEVLPPSNAVPGERKIGLAEKVLSRPKDAVANEIMLAGNSARVNEPESEATDGRKVDVRYGIKRRQFSVSKTITTGEIISVAVMFFKPSFGTDAAVLKESYRSENLHLERRLRHYELVAPVMNSWDRDTQNELVLEASDSPRHDLDLLARGAPQVCPAQTSVQLYHSYKKGSWVKHWVTLRSNGQVFLSKVKPAPSGAWIEKEVLGIAHMSDFDIYTLTGEQVKALKLKRKYNCAVKSQHKSTLFEKSPENFVHFFSTSNAEEYQNWMDACQSWRSWYLSQESTSDAPSAAVPVTHTRAYEDGVHDQIDYSKTSSVPHQRGNSKPPALTTSFDDSPGDRYGSVLHQRSSRDYFDDFDGSFPSDSDQFRSPLSPQARQIPFHLRNSGGQAQSFSPSLPQEPFRQGGLLGRSYSQRQKVVHEDSSRAAGNPDFKSGAFMPHGLLAQGVAGPAVHAPASRRPSTSRNNSPHTNAADSSSGRRPSNGGSHSRPGTAGSGKGGSSGHSVPPVPDMPELGSLHQPLVDFTPQFKEAPQWRGDGKGRGVRVREGMPLVDAAGSRREKGRDFRPEDFRRGNAAEGSRR